VSLPLEFCGVLRLWRVAQTEARHKAERWYDLDLVFTDPLGLPHTIQRVARDFAKALVEADIRGTSRDAAV
jgi:hypothetical protein